MNLLLYHYFEKITITIAIVFNFIGVLGFLRWYVLLHLLRIEKSDLFISQDIDTSRKTHFPGNEFLKEIHFLLKLALILQEFQ